jgi:HEAT repeat protein
LGAFGFVALGMKAKPFVPSLMALNRDQDQRTRYLALFALRCLGPEASEALPEMIECLHDPDMTIRSEAAMGIGEIHIEPEKSVHILMDFLDKYRTDRMQWFPRDDAIRSLAKFGAQARPAVPILIGLLNDREKGIREAATNALREIDADAAAQAGVK